MVDFEMRTGNVDGGSGVGIKECREKVEGLEVRARVNSRTTGTRKK